ncbi:MAG: bactofilin family protein [Syntrophorhabdaceae bacterium]
MLSDIPAINEVQEDQIITVIAEDLEIKGTISFQSSVMIKGIFEGEILSEGLLVIGPEASVNATIHTHTLVSHGTVTGNVTASHQIILKQTANHAGDIYAPYIMIENGAALNGSCKMERQAREPATVEPVTQKAGNVREINTPNAAFTAAKAS